MNLIQGQSINSKLTMLTAVSSGIALLLSTVAFFVNDWSSIRQSKIRQLSALGGVIASNSTATLAFDQPMAAEELLASLGSRPTVHFACLYDSDGNLFAEFRRDADAQFDPPPRPQHGSNFTKTGFLDIAMPVLEEDGTELGTLYMHTAMTDLKNQLYTHASIAASVLIASLVVAVLLASRLQRFISGPILQLAGAAKQISSEGNYSIRVEKTSDDEIGDLYDQFNGMLDRIQMADEEIHQTHTQLQAANNELEERVQKRTEQLSIANDQLKNEIEERARVHNELKQSEKRVRAIVDSAFDAIITVDERGAIESFNPAAEKMFGYKASEVLGAEVNVLMANQYADRGNFVKHYAETGETQIMGGQVEFEGRRQDGSEFALELFVSEFRLFDRRVFTGFIRDLTAANEAAEKLQDMNERLVDISRQAGMAEVANGVLHNVGNVLKSVNVSASLISETVRNSEV
ncbi:MAG: PAS domain S-box protein, partial [Pirellulaceae bacterium]|nr:PAS domain S-box protein [Pirellulaceae bacterium]